MEGFPEKLADMNGERLLEQVQILRALPQSCSTGRITGRCGAHTDGDRRFMHLSL